MKTKEKPSVVVPAPCLSPKQANIKLVVEHLQIASHALQALVVLEGSGYFSTQVKTASGTVAYALKNVLAYSALAK